MRGRLAWAFLAVATLAAVLDTVFTAAHRSLLSEATWAEHGWPLTPLAGIGCALMGALIVSRHPKHPLGWLLCAASLLSVTLAAEAYSVWVLDGGGPGPSEWAHVAAWAGPLLGWPAFTALVVAFLLSPDGRLPSPRWRWALWMTMAGLLLHTLGTLTTRPGEAVVGEDYGHRTVSGPLLNVGAALVAVGLVASAVSIAWRLRTAKGDQRRQVLWIASAATFLAIGVLVILAVPRVQGVEGTWLAALPLRLAQVAVPLCVAVAVLRHRLVQIDVIVNRALVLGTATALVAVGYVAVVVVGGLAVGQGTPGFWPSVLATALVALAFQPLRRRVVTMADRLAFGAAAAPYDALADLSRRLGDSSDPADLLPAIADAAAHAVGARRVTVLLHLHSGPDQNAVSALPADARRPGSSADFTVSDGDDLLGLLTIEMPAGRPLRPWEHRLLSDLADQAGIAFRSAQLAAELSDEVERLDRRTRELTESRRRLIRAADAERSRVELAIAQQVLRHLTPLPDRLDRLAHPPAQDAHALDAASLGPLITSVTTALDSLREITRGVFPAQLVRSGLPMALTSLLARSPSSGTLHIHDGAAGRRFDPRVEAAAYFCVAEAINSVTSATVVLDAPHDELRLVISGPCRGELDVAQMKDRVEAAGGSVTVARTEGHAVLEVRAAAPAVVV